MGPGNLPGDLPGSAAKQNESTGGNVAAGKANLPGAGSAAFQAETERRNAAPRTTAGSAIRISQVRGAILADRPKESPDLSNRTAADYLPAQLRAQLIAEGKLSPAGMLLPAEPQTEKTVKEFLTISAADCAVTSESDLSRTEQAERPPVSEKGTSALAKLAGLFRKLFR